MKILRFNENKIEHIKPSVIYHGGDFDNLKSLYKKFVVLSSEEKMKYSLTLKKY